MTRSSLALAVLVVATLACVDSRFVPTNAPPRALAPRPVEEVAVFTTSLPERPYAEIGMVTAITRSGPPQAKASLIEAVRQEAAKHGCDGIIYAPGSAVLAEATCIVYK